MRPQGWWAAAVGLAILLGQPASAADTVTIALVGGTTGWDFSVANFGKRLGLFEKKGINVEIAQTDNTAASLQAVISGSADIANIGVTAFIGAALKGAPLKMVSSTFKGTSDWVWYVRSDSAIKSFKDLTEKTTIGVNSKTASQFIILTAMLAQYGVKADIIATGTLTAAMTQVMTGQIDVGTDGNGLLGLPQLTKGEIRPVAYGRELESMRGVSVRGLVVTEDTLRDRRDVIVRFLQAYQETIDWMYRDPKAVEWFAEQTQSSLDEARRVKTEHFPDGAMTVGEVAGVDFSVKQGLEFNRLDRAPTAEELAKMFEVVWAPGK